MPYLVQFVGMVCFVRQDDGSRLALMPDGRRANPRHVARILVDADRFSRDPEGWQDADQEQIRNGLFVLKERCTLILQGTDGAGGLDTADHDSRLIRLRDVNPAFEIDPATARTIANVAIRQGRLEAFRYPNTNASDPDASTISQLEVPYDEEITITVRPRDGSADRSIFLRAGTEIGIGNDLPFVLSTRRRRTEEDHFHLFEHLAGAGVHLGPTPPAPPAPPSPSTHRIFGNPIVDGVRCPNTGWP